MKERQKQQLLKPVEKAEEQVENSDPEQLSRSDWLVMIVFYPIPAPHTKRPKPSGFKRLLEVLSALLKIAGMAYGLYQAVMGA
ncbi:MAG: hypothetical protein AAF433_05865 [Bacteroidota bacterium]